MSNYEETKPAKGGVIANIFAALAFLALGICLLVLNADSVSDMIYSFASIAVGACFICFGAYYMIKYFFKQEYKSICNYGFTMGVILAIIGSGFLFLSNVVVVFLDFIIIFAGALLGTIMLQQSFALFYMRKATWFLSFLFGACSIAASIYFGFFEKIVFFSGNLIPCLYFIIIGGLSLLSMLLMVIGIHGHKKEANVKPVKHTEEVSAPEDSIFEDEPSFETPVVEKVELEPGSDDLFDE
ncbi:hypothetical protein [Pseudobutyrivibrio sp.]|uniref:hypothetical protein n=1 Tax=Pseudobutyrivibrio sp. TaxID=2014367 RepID=UPI00386B8C3F